MRDIYVRVAILEQKLRFEARRGTQCVLSATQVRCKDVPFITEAFMHEGMAPRLLSLHLDGNLLADSGAELLMRDIVLHPDAALTLLDLSGNSKLGAPGVKQVASGLGHPACTLKELRLASCGLSGFDVEPLAEVRFDTSRLEKLDLSLNLLDDRACEGLLEACGGDQPFVDLTVQGNPLSPACISKVSRVRAAIELGGRRASEVPPLSAEEAVRRARDEDLELEACLPTALDSSPKGSLSAHSFRVSL